MRLLIVLLIILFCIIVASSLFSDFWYLHKVKQNNYWKYIVLVILYMLLFLGNMMFNCNEVGEMERKTAINTVFLLLSLEQWSSYMVYKKNEVKRRNISNNKLILLLATWVILVIISVII